MKKAATIAALHRKAGVQFTAGAFRDALKTVRRILALDPDDIEALKGAAFFTRTLGHATESLRFFNRVLALQPSDDPIRAIIRHMTAEALVEETAPAAQPPESVEPLPDAGLLLLDNTFPSRASAFRHGEFSAYLQAFPNSRVYSSIHDIVRYTRDRNFHHVAADFRARAGIAAHRVRRYDMQLDFRCRAAYCVFLNNANLFFSNNDRLAADRLVFTLYPGGGFELDDPVSDAKLRRLLDDPRLHRVVTTQNLTRRYLLDRGLCSADRLLHVYGGIVPAAWGGEHRSRAPRRDKTLRVCFVAHRYTHTGDEKGYGLVAATIRAMGQRRDVAFHVVGDFDHATLDLGGATNVTFHGLQPATFFPAFYGAMDMIVSPNVSSMRLNGGIGSFDGFPTTACVEAGLRGVGMLLSDLEDMNLGLDGTPILEPGVEFDQIGRDPDELVARIEHYVAHPEALVTLGERGRRALRRVFSFERQMAPRMALLRDALG